MKLKLNHIGIVTDEITKYTEFFQAIGFDRITDSVPDEYQNVTASFVTVDEQDSIHMEILEPTAPDSPISRFIKKKGGVLHHLCFEVENLEEIVKTLQEKEVQALYGPADCPAYDTSFKRECSSSSRIAFFLFDRLLLEFIQKGE